MAEKEEREPEKYIDTRILFRYSWESTTRDMKSTKASLNADFCLVSNALEKEEAEEVDAQALVFGRRRRRILGEVTSRRLCACLEMMYLRKERLSDRKIVAWWLALEDSE